MTRASSGVRWPDTAFDQPQPRHRSPVPPKWHRHPAGDSPKSHSHSTSVSPTWHRHPAGDSPKWRSHSTSVPPFFAALAALILIIFPTATQAADEPGLKTLWDQHTASPGDHTAVAASAQKWITANPADPLLPVAQGIYSWHLLHQGNHGEAKAILESHLTRNDTPIAQAAQTIAKAWLTRLDRESVVGALQLFYRKEVGYPESLAAITTHPKIPQSAHPPLTDRFGAPWAYKLTGLKGLPKFANQRFELGSSTLRNSAELAPALEIPYATGITAQPTKVWSARTPPMVQLNFTAGSSVLSAGKTDRDTLVAYIGEKIIILANRDYWKILPTP